MTESSDKKRLAQLESDIPELRGAISDERLQHIRRTCERRELSAVGGMAVSVFVFILTCGDLKAIAQWIIIASFVLFWRLVWMRVKSRNNKDFEINRRRPIP
jgi:hypothetical protein